jgi:putative colanic acid biosynthesis acetyltransferase WcaF
MTMSDKLNYQDLSLFKVPKGYRGRNILIVQLWWIVEAILFRNSPQYFYAWRRFLLRLFGAKIDAGVLIRPSARVTYPWKLSIGAHSWVGDDAVIYSLGKIEIGLNSVVSQKCYLCAGTHNHETLAFDIESRPIRIGSQCWLATDVFVAPGVSIGDGTVVGARSSVYHDLPRGMICYGSPAKPVRRRKARIRKLSKRH